MISVITLIKSKGQEPEEEEIEVSTLKNAEKEVKEIVDNFNNTLRPGEKPREFIKIVWNKNIQNDIDLECLLSEFRKFMIKVSHEANNLFGSAWCKENDLRIAKCYEKLDIHKPRGFYLMRNYMSKSSMTIRSNFENIIDLTNEDIKNILIDELKKCK